MKKLVFLLLFLSHASAYSMVCENRETGKAFHLTFFEGVKKVILFEKEAFLFQPWYPPNSAYVPDAKCAASVDIKFLGELVPKACYHCSDYDTENYSLQDINGESATLKVVTTGFRLNEAVLTYKNETTSYLCH